MKRFVNIIAVLLCISMLVTLSACGASNQANDGKTLTVASTGVTGTLDPGGECGAVYFGFFRYCIDPLLTFSSTGELWLEAAESYETSDDMTVYTFHLRKDGKWSDGSPVIADDFINTIHRTLYPDSGSIYTNELYVLKGAAETQPADGEEFDPSTLANVGVKAIDDYTLEYTLKAPCAYFLKLLTLPVYHPSKSGVATRENKNWYNNPETYLTNGAYYPTELTYNEVLVYQKNPYYHQADKVKIETIYYRMIPDLMSQVAAYETNEVDITSALNDTVIEQYDGKPDLRISPSITTIFFQYNFDNAPVMKDVRIREAFALAVNRSQICTAVGSDTRPTYYYVAEEMISNIPGSDKKFSQEVAPLFSEDADRAKQLLAEAGYPGGAGFPELTLTYASGQKNADVSVAFQAQIKEVLGITIKLQSVETGVFYQTRRSGDYQILRNSWTADYTDPSNYLVQFGDNGGFSRSAAFSDDKYNDLVTQANLTTDPTERNKLMHDAEHVLVSEQFYINPIYTSFTVSLRDPKLVNIQVDDKGTSMYRFAYFES